MKKHILGVALAALLVVTAGYAADEFVPRRSGSSAEWGFNSSDEVRIQRMTDDGKAQVEAACDTTTAAAWATLLATTEQIDWRLNTGTGHLKDISEELAAQSLQLGVIEGNGTTSVANEELMKLQLGVIEGNGTTNVANNSTFAATRELQLGVIEGNGITAVARLDTALLQLGVIEGNGTTAVAHLNEIEDKGTTIISELEAQSLQLGVIEGNGTTLNSKFGTLGQKNMAGSAPVVIASDQAPITVTVDGGVSITNPTGASAVFAQGAQVDGASITTKGIVVAGKDSSGRSQFFETTNDGNLVLSYASNSTSDTIHNSLLRLPPAANGTGGYLGTFNYMVNPVSDEWVRLRGDTDGLYISDISNGTQTNDIKVTMDSEVVATTNAIVDGWDATTDSGISADGPQVMVHYDSTKPAAVDDGDAVPVLADQYGRPLQGVEPESGQFTFTSADATAASQLIAKTASKRIHLTSLLVSTDTAMNIQFQDDTGPTVLIEQLYFAANGGVPILIPLSTPLVVSTNEDLDVITSVAGNISVTGTYYLAP